MVQGSGPSSQNTLAVKVDIESEACLMRLKQTDELFVQQARCLALYPMLTPQTSHSNVFLDVIYNTGLVYLVVLGFKVKMPLELWRLPGPQMSCHLCLPQMRVWSMIRGLRWLRRMPVLTCEVGYN